MLDDASPVRPLGATRLRGVALREVKGLSATVLHDAAGGDWPSPGRWAELAFGTVLCTTPNEWLVLHPRLARLEAPRVTPLHGGRFVLEVSGPHAGQLLAKLVALDLHPRVFKEDTVAATMAAQVPVLLWRFGDGFRLCCARSYAQSLAEAFERG